MPAFEKDCLFYDAECPLCVAEVRKLAVLAGDALECIPVQSLPEDADTPTKPVLLSRLHLRDANGNWLIGLDANIQAWQHTKYGWLWRILKWPGIHYLALNGYEVWLKYRLKRMPQSTCNDRICS